VEGEWPVLDLPFRRWREVEVHHADLGLGFSWRSWSKLYVERELARTIAHLPERTIAEPVELTSNSIDDDRSNLAWLIGRAEPPPGTPKIKPWQATTRSRTP
jgi:maleylpyruvate isomerase